VKDLKVEKGPMPASRLDHLRGIRTFRWLVLREGKRAPRGEGSKVGVGCFREGKSVMEGILEKGGNSFRTRGVESDVIHEVRKTR